MEKYKTIVLIEKMRKCLEEGNSEEALALAQSIDKKKLKNMSDLSIVGESFFQNRKYDEAKELYLYIYQKTPSRRIVAQLVHLSIKLNDITEANQFLDEFIKLAPNDFYQHIFRYSIDKLTKAPLVKLIEDLVALKNAEYIESWAYELAKLYHKAGLKDQCVAECDDIILWFGEGEFVERAKVLRAYYKGELKIDESDSKNDYKQEEVEERGEVGELGEIGEIDEVEEVKEADEINEKEEAERTEESIQKQIEDEELGELESALAEQVSMSFPEDDLKNTITPREANHKESMLSDSDTIQSDTVESTTNKVAVGKSVDDDSADIEVEKEIYRLLDEEIEEQRNRSFNDEIAVMDEAAVSMQTDIIEEDNEEEDTKREIIKEENINKIDSKTQLESPQSDKIQKKIHLKELTNEQLIGDEEDDLLIQLTNNHVNLLDIFGNFMRMEVIRKQLIRSMDQVLTQRSMNLIITGETQSGKTRLAKCFAKLLHRMKLIKSTKVALVDGEKLNSMNLMAKKEQLKDCVVVIEHAGMMTKDTVKTLLELSTMFSPNIAIILEDTREKINRLLRGNSQLNSIFNNRVHLHKYTLEDYMGFAYDYILEHDYEIEMEAFIALQNEFTAFIHKKRENALNAVFSCLDAIMLKSEKRSAEQLKELVQTGHFADSELMVLKREDIKS